MSLTDAQKLAVQAAFAAASRAGDIDALAAMTEAGAVVWHNHDEIAQPAAESRKTLLWLHRTVRDLAWDDVAVLATSTGFVWQALMTGSTPNGPLHVPTCVVATLSDDGLVRRLDEYLDARALAPLRG